MTVKELIKKLEKVENKNLEVVIYTFDEGFRDIEVSDISLVDEDRGGETHTFVTLEPTDLVY